MDAAAYLKKQGWRGAGHSLDQTDRGIVKPLLVSKKVDALGVGIKKYAAVSDQWWLRAYDQGLKDFGTGKESALATAQKHGVNRGGLYARFVRGQEIPGTIGQRVESATSSDTDDDVPSAPIVSASNTPPIHPRNKSKDVKRKTAKDDTKPRKRKRTSTAQVVDSIVTASDGLSSASRDKAIKKQIRAYVYEATQRGILPPDSAKSSRSKAAPPSEQDMKAVLKLAKLHKTKEAPQLERKKLIRRLKRAARKHVESQSSNAPL